MVWRGGRASFLHHLLSCSPFPQAGAVFRSWTRMRAAATKREFLRMYGRLLTQTRPRIATVRMYTTGKGHLPRTASVKTPSGVLEFRIDSVDDLLTFGECFGKLDYRLSGNERLVVDCGANVGMSALSFLAHAFLADAPRSHVVCIKPDPRNLARLRQHLAANRMENRATVVPRAVGATAGTAQFQVESTGRYGAIPDGAAEGLSPGRVVDQITVDVLDATACLTQLAAECGCVDVLKLDIVGQEVPFLGSLSPATLGRIGVIYAEVESESPRLAGFTTTRQGTVTRYFRP